MDCSMKQTFRIHKSKVVVDGLLKVNDDQNFYIDFFNFLKFMDPRVDPTTHQVRTDSLVNCRNRNWGLAQLRLVPEPIQFSGLTVPTQ